MKSLKKIYSYLYKKNQLKEVYNNLFELRDVNTLRHNLKSRNTNVDFFNETQEVSIPGVGTFQLNKFQTALSGLIIEFYFGNKNLVKGIFSYLNLKLENEEKETKKLNEIRILRFFYICKEIKIIDENYNLTNEIINKPLGNPEFKINSSAGRLFEIFAYKKINEIYNTNYEEFFQNSIDRNDIKYIYTILKIIYIAPTESLQDISLAVYNLFSNMNEENLNKIYEKITFPKDFPNKIIDEKLRNYSKEDKEKQGIFFEFKYRNENLDITIKNKETVISMLDLKCSEIRFENVKDTTKLKYNNTKSISTSNDGLDKYISDTIDIDGEYNDFSLGLIRLTHNFNQSEIVIEKFDCLYISYKEQHKKLMKMLIDTGEEEYFFPAGNPDFTPINSEEQSVGFPITVSTETFTADFASQNKKYKEEFYDKKEEEKIAATIKLLNDIEESDQKETYLANKKFEYITGDKGGYSYNTFPEKNKKSFRKKVFTTIKSDYKSGTDFQKKLYDKLIRYIGKADAGDFMKYSDHFFKYVELDKVKKAIQTIKESIYENKNNMKVINARISSSHEINIYLSLDSDQKQKVRNAIFSIKDEVKSSGNIVLIKNYNYAVKAFSRTDNPGAYKRTKGAKIEYYEELLSEELRSKTEVAISEITKGIKPKTGVRTIKKLIKNDSKENVYLKLNNKEKSDVRKAIFNLKQDYELEAQFIKDRYNDAVSQFENVDKKNYNRYKIK